VIEFIRNLQKVLHAFTTTGQSDHFEKGEIPFIREKSGFHRSLISNKLFGHTGSEQVPRRYGHSPSVCFEKEKDGFLLVDLKSKHFIRNNADIVGGPFEGCLNFP
jgi:hypothetical protein